MILRRSALTLTLFLAVGLCSTACVSISLDRTKSKPSTTIRYTTPGSPFSQLSNQSVDVAWKNEKNGSIISLLSECGGSRDPRLEALVSEVLQSLSDEKVIKDEMLQFVGREAKRTTAIGKVDGIETAVDLLVVKKDGCSFVMSLVALPSHLEADRISFDRFLRSVVIP